MQHPDGWKGKWTRCWNERLLSWVWKKKFKKSSCIQVIHMTTNGREVHLEPEFCISSHQIRQCCCTCGLKTGTKPTAKQGRENQTKPKSLWQYLVLGAGKVHFPDPGTSTLTVILCNHLPARCSRTSPSLFLSLDIALNINLPPWHPNVFTAQWQQAWPVKLLQRPEQHLQTGGALI